MSNHGDVDLVLELINELGWPEPFAHGAKREYHRWLQLKQWAKDTDAASLAPSSTIEMVWRTHRDWTVDYAVTCNGLGRFVHNFPAELRNPVARKAAYAHTLQSYRALFHENPPEDFWEPFGAPSASATAIAAANASVAVSDLGADAVMNSTDHDLGTETLPNILDEVVGADSTIARNIGGGTEANISGNMHENYKSLSIPGSNGLPAGGAVDANLSTTNHLYQQPSSFLAGSQDHASTLQSLPHSEFETQASPANGNSVMSVPGPEAIRSRKDQLASNTVRTASGLGSSFRQGSGALSLARHVGGGIIPTRRGRGRPRKQSLPAERMATPDISELRGPQQSTLASHTEGSPTSTSADVNAAQVAPLGTGRGMIKRGRGRPRKSEDPTVRAAEAARKAARMRGLVLRPLTQGEKRGRGRPRFSDYVKLDDLHPEERQEAIQRTALLAPQGLGFMQGNVDTMHLATAGHDPSEIIDEQSKSATKDAVVGDVATYSDNVHTAMTALPSHEMTSTTDGDNGNWNGAYHVSSQSAPVKRGRGRPRKDGTWPVPRPKSNTPGLSAASGLPSRAETSSEGRYAADSGDVGRDVVSDGTLSSPPTTVAAIEGHGP